MLDKKSIAVLKALNKLLDGNAYKVVVSEEILSVLSQKSQYDKNSIKQIVEFLEKQEYINIKFSEEDTFCYSLLPKARICLEQTKDCSPKRSKFKPSLLFYCLIVISSLIGSFLGLLLFYFIL